LTFTKHQQSPPIFALFFVLEIIINGQIFQKKISHPKRAAYQLRIAAIKAE